MGDFRNQGPTCGAGKPQDVNDGTSPPVAMPLPGPVNFTRSWSVLEYLRRLGYVQEAWSRCEQFYVKDAIIEQIGEDAWDILTGILVGLLMALGVLIVTTGVGAAVGGAIGAFGAGFGAAPGAAFGADIGLTIGEGILAWMGLAFLAAYIVGHLRDMGRRFTSAISMAWHSNGRLCAIDGAAREFAGGVGFFVSLLLQAIVVFIARGAAKQGTARLLAQLRDSLLFKHCPRLEPWLVKNYGRLRAKYVPLRWVVLDDTAPKIPGTSIPESMRLKVGEREYFVWRDPTKPAFKTGEPKGPALKHLGERASGTEARPMAEQATRELRDQLQSAPPPAELDQLPPGAREQALKDWRKVENPQRWEKSPWSTAAQTDFPISALAAALDQAEARLIFEPPQVAAKPRNIPNWELVIDTTGPVWRVEHALYTDKPKW